MFNGENCLQMHFLEYADETSLTLSTNKTKAPSVLFQRDPKNFFSPMLVYRVDFVSLFLRGKS